MARMFFVVVVELVLVLVTFVLGLFLKKFAPLGYEDEYGWHCGNSPSK